MKKKKVELNAGTEYYLTKWQLRREELKQVPKNVQISTENETDLSIYLLAMLLLLLPDFCISHYITITQLEMFASYM